MAVNGKPGKSEIFLHLHGIGARTRFNAMRTLVLASVRGHRMSLRQARWWLKFNAS